MRERTVFIHTNAKQWLTALVAAHALRRNSREPRRFDVELIRTEDCSLLYAREGEPYLREGVVASWRNDDLQSFVPLRFIVPQLMDYQGRAVVIEPDVFAIGDINELLDQDMNRAAILARPMPGDGLRPSHWASSVMLLDCSQLRHWNLERDLAQLFAQKVDYCDWVCLLREPQQSISELGNEWNDFDHLGPQTRLLHNVDHQTQPWRSGLPADFGTQGSTWSVKVAHSIRQLRSRIDGSSASGYYRRHPDAAQERLFFQLLAECLSLGTISRQMLEREIAKRHIRADAPRLLRRAQ